MVITQKQRYLAVAQSETTKCSKFSYNTHLTNQSNHNNPEIRTEIGQQEHIIFPIAGAETHHQAAGRTEQCAHK